MKQFLSYHDYFTVTTTRKQNPDVKKQTALTMGHNVIQYILKTTVHNSLSAAITLVEKADLNDYR